MKLLNMSLSFLSYRINQICCVVITSLFVAGPSWSSDSAKPGGEDRSRPKSAMVRDKVESLEAHSLKKPLSVRVVPSDVVLWGKNASQRFLVQGTFADGLERDITHLSRFSISDSTIVKIDERGGVKALTNGEVLLKVEVAGQVVRSKVRVEGSQETKAFSFARDIGGIFTKKGCNSSDCHGSVKGKGGLKLSTNALYPRDDHKWITVGGIYQVLTSEAAGQKIPRVDLKNPENSLLLKKPTFAVPHGGGQVLQPGSADYETILQWIRSGAPYGEDGGESVRVTDVEVFPKEAVLDPKGKHQLLVTARLSNGRTEDFTDQVFYISNNPEAITVNSEGLVEAVKTGETTVMIRASGFAVSTRFGVIAKPIANYPKVARNNFIDDYVFAKLRKFNVIPSELSTDSEFLRRVCLDLSGTLPPPNRVREFLTSKDPAKREKLIETLLNSPEYVEYWTYRLSDLFRVALYAAGFTPKKTLPYWEWIRDSIAENKPYNQIALERISAQGNAGPTANYYPGEFQPNDNMAEQVRVFMGRRLDCAQCHNHPYETWAQDQYWGMAAFFGRLSSIGPVLADVPGGGFAKGGETGPARPMLHPRTKQPVQPAFLDGQILPEDKRTDLRMELAKWMTSHSFFAEAAVNRMWGYFFGRGIVDPVDDFRSTNPPTHPELLKALADDFVSHKYDLKHLVRTIARSRTYQLASAPNETNKGDLLNYSHALPRAIDAEVLLDAISTVSGVPEVFFRATGAGGKDPAGTRAICIKDTDSYPSRFLDMHGRPDRMMVPQRDGKANLSQALHMLAGVTYTEKISREGSRIDRLIKAGSSANEIIEEFCLAGLSRFPTSEEVNDLKSLVQKGSSRRQALEDLLWGLMTSREFAYNH
jgi:uncharacterized protein DUF1549/uncharacterized protein DUF1553/Big-like domain-containing protein